MPKYKTIFINGEEFVMAWQSWLDFSDYCESRGNTSLYPKRWTDADQAALDAYCSGDA